MVMNSIALMVFICAILIIVIGIYAWQQGKTVGARRFSLLMLSMSIYILGYSFELASLHLNTMIFWNKVQYFGILTFPTIYLLFASQFSGKSRWQTKKNVALLFLLPAIFLFIKLFDSSFHLIYRSIELDNSGIIPLLEFQKGPLYYVYVAYNLVMVTLGTFLLIVKRPFASALYLRQTNIILAVSAVLYASYLLYLSGYDVFPFLKNLDLNPFFYTLWGLAISYAILRYRLFDLAPIARDALIEILNDGVLVIDDQYRLVDSNPKAQQLFGWEKTPVGSPLEKLDLNLVENELLQSLKSNYTFEKQFTNNGDTSVFEVTISILRNTQSLIIGYLLVLHDITLRKGTEKQLQELSLVDDLTKLLNRRGFNILSDQLCSFCLRMSMNAVLFFFDLDNLKQINDQYGHVMGDQAIMDMGDLLRQSFRATDIIARMGGDEFVVFAIETVENSCETMTRRLDQNHKAKLLEGNRSFRLEFSMGTSFYKWESPQPIEKIVMDSDSAMYKAKQLKKDQSVSMIL